MNQENPVHYKRITRGHKGVIAALGLLVLSSVALIEGSPVAMEDSSYPIRRQDGSLTYGPQVCLEHRLRKNVDSPVTLSCGENLLQAAVKYPYRELGRIYWSVTGKKPADPFF